MKRIVFLLLFYILTFYLHKSYAQIITTIAGVGNIGSWGSGGNGGEGGPATAANLSFIGGLTSDSANNIYISCSHPSLAANTVRKVNSTGLITRYAGNDTAGFSGDGGPATAAKLYQPASIVFDSKGNLYIADMYINGRVRKVDPSGIITTFAGNGSASVSGDGGQATAAQMSRPCGLRLDAAGNLYITECNNRVLRKVSPTGIITTIAGTGGSGSGGDGGPATAATFTQPTTVITDASGKIYIADMSANRVRVIAGGTINTFAGNGTAASGGDGGPASAATLNTPIGMCFDASGNLYIAEKSKIRVVNMSTGIISTYAGTGTLGFSGDGGPATAAQIREVNIINMDASGNLYISDNGNHRIRKVSSSGVITTVAGIGTIGFSGDGGPATAAQLSYPSGAWPDGAGNLYISDALNYRVRVINSAGIISTFAGTGAAAYGGDGGPATAAGINYPGDFARDAAGNMYFMELVSNRIRKIGSMVTDHPPYFPNSDLSLIACKDSTPMSINYLLGVVDSDAGQTITWSIAVPPMHGTLGGFSTSAVSTGGLLTPTGLTYVGAAGYAGLDSFTVKISDGSDSALQKVYVTVKNCNLGVQTIAGDAAKIEITPNPSGGLFHIAVASFESGYAGITITNILGQKVKELTVLTNNDVPVELNEPAGMYFISVQLANGTVKCKTVIQK